MPLLRRPPSAVPCEARWDRRAGDEGRLKVGEAGTRTIVHLRWPEIAHCGSGWHGRDANHEEFPSPSPILSAQSVGVVLSAAKLCQK
eukprot:3636032-Pleurochrysis_carterae.AAC.1